ncbi:hypothetical protein CMI37_18580 [Candidatus Pacearchaeota archaeon]|nr:hypothetical protein [Candidatus Pacearchaeota archaeon]
MADRKAKGGKKLTQLGRRRKPAAPRSKVRAPRPRDYRKESGATLAPSELSTLRRAIRKESGAAVSAKELRDFLRRKPRRK